MSRIGYEVSDYVENQMELELIFYCVEKKKPIYSKLGVQKFLT